MSLQSCPAASGATGVPAAEAAAGWCWGGAAISLSRADRVEGQSAATQGGHPMLALLQCVGGHRLVQMQRLAEGGLMYTP